MNLYICIACYSQSHDCIDIIHSYTMQIDQFVYCIHTWPISNNLDSIVLIHHSSDWEISLNLCCSSNTRNGKLTLMTRIKRYDCQALYPIIPLGLT